MATEQRISGPLKATLLMAGTMTIMAGAVIAPALPQMAGFFGHVEDADILVRLLMTIPALFIAIFAPVAGNIVDKIGRKPMLIAGLAVYATAGTAGLYIEDIYWLLASRALLGFAVGGIMTTVTTLAGDYFEGEERDKFIGTLGAFISIGGLVFITVGGALADINWHWPFLVYGFAGIVFVLALMFVIEPDKSNGSGGRVEHKSVDDYPKMTVALIVIIAFAGMAFFYLMPVQIPFLLQSYGLNNTSTGIAIGVSMLTGAALSINYKRLRRKLDFRQVYALSFGLLGVGYIIISLSSSFSVLLAGMAVGGAGMGLIMPNSNMWMLSMVPASVRGRMIGLLTTMFFLGQFTSPLLFIPLIKLCSLEAAFGISGGQLVALSIFFAFDSVMRRGR